MSNGGEDQKSVKIFIVNQSIVKVLFKIDPFFLGTDIQLKVPLPSFQKRALCLPAGDKHSVPLG